MHEDSKGGWYEIKESFPGMRKLSLLCLCIISMPFTMLQLVFLYCQPPGYQRCQLLMLTCKHVISLHADKLFFASVLVVDKLGAGWRDNDILVAVNNKQGRTLQAELG